MLYRMTTSAPIFGLRREIDRLFEDTFGREGGSFTPAVDIKENEKEIRLDVELPGLKPENVEVIAENGVLTIRGEKQSERKEGEDDRYQVVERSYGTFVRTFQLPQGVNEDLIKGEFENGVLSVSIPKAALPQPKRIQIGGSQHKEQATVGAGNVSNQQSTGKTSGKNSTTTSQRERDSEKMAASGR
ncbi:MAG TPA: Hsp20/alpha crystallin family protein [Gemmatimonadaceae bacterium]|nr:Hsp20/alpha crystallin family protein [Gemmatimonadaceae bacterium]